MTDEATKTAPADKSAPAKPEVKAPSSTEMRLKALIGDLLKQLDAVFGSAEQLSEEAGDSGDPDPMVSGKGGQKQLTPEEQAKADAEKAKSNQAPADSWEAAQSVLAKAVSDTFDKTGPDGFGAWIEATFDDRLVYRANGDTFEVDYSIGVDGTVQFGTPVRVETEYTPAEEKSNADYSWDDCIADQLAKGYDQAKAAKICGYIKAKNNLREMRGVRGMPGSDSEEDIMGTEMDKLKSELDAANQMVTAKTQELEAANGRLEVFEQGQRDAAWANMRDSHVPKGWLAGPDDAAKANKETELRKEFEANSVGFMNKVLSELKGKSAVKSAVEGAQFGNRGAADDSTAVSRELRELTGRR